MIHWRSFLIFFSISCFMSSYTELAYVSNINYSSETEVFQNGDVVLGGLFSVHFEFIPSINHCKRMSERGIKWLQSMIYTIDQINGNQRLLPNITIGYDLRDTCNSASNAIEESLSYVIYSHLDDDKNNNALSRVLCSVPNTNVHVRSKRQFESNQKIVNADNGQFKSIPNIIGVIGGRSSRVSMAVASLLSNFNIVQVSYSSTSRLLSNTAQYRSFFRTVPTDENQVKAMIDIVQHFNWTYIAVIAVDDSYGRLAAESFKKKAAKLGICIAIDHRFSNQNNQQEIADIVSELKINVRAKVIILLCAENEAIDFLHEAERQNLTGRIFIGSDAWGDTPRVTNIRRDIIEGMLGIVLDGHLVPEYEEYLKTLNLCNNRRNPWFNQLWLSKARQKNISINLNNCHIPRKLLNNYTDLFYQENSKVAYVMDAIYAIAHALHNMLGCNESFCPSMKVFNRRVFLQYMRNVSFNAITVRDFHFSPEGDALGIYQIKNLQPSSTHPNKLEFKTVGEWDMSQSSGSELKIKAHEIIWTNRDPDHIPISRCSDDCQPGQFRKFSSIISCCWECISCMHNAISNTTNAEHCYICLPDQKANANMSECIDKVPVVSKWTDPLSISVLVFAGIAYLLILITWIIIMKYRQSPIVKASNILLTNFLLAGISLCALSALAFVAPISILTCRIGMFTSIISIVFILSTIMAKTNRISKIFQNRLSNAKNPSTFLKNSTQAFFVFALTGIEAFIIFCSLIVDPMELYRYLSPANEVILQCDTKLKISLYTTLTYLVILNVICLYLAFKTRKLPENYNEAKYISFTSLVITCFISTLLPAYFSTIGSFRVAVASIGLLCLSCAILGCMFLPKVYILLFESDSNTKENAILDVVSYSFGNSNTISTISYNRSIRRSSTMTSRPPLSGTTPSSSFHIGLKSIKIANNND